MIAMCKKQKIFVSTLFPILFFASLYITSRTIFQYTCNNFLEGRFVPFDHTKLWQPELDFGNSEEFNEKFKSKDPIELLQLVMNFVKKADHFCSDSIQVMYDHVKNGKGTICGGRSVLYYSA